MLDTEHKAIVIEVMETVALVLLDILLGPLVSLYKPEHSSLLIKFKLG